MAGGGAGQLDRHAQHHGSFVQNGGVYQVRGHAQGSRTASNVGDGHHRRRATVQVLAQPGAYQRNTTYTILRAQWRPERNLLGRQQQPRLPDSSLAYDANDVYLTLAQSSSAFSAGAQTANQYAVGAALASPTRRRPRLQTRC